MAMATADFRKAGRETLDRAIAAQPLWVTPEEAKLVSDAITALAEKKVTAKDDVDWGTFTKLQQAALRIAKAN